MLHLGECAIRDPRPPSRHVPTKQWLSSAPLRSSSYIAISPSSSFLFQGAPFGFNVVGPLHKETDPAAHDLDLPDRWSPLLLVLSSGVPRIARSPSTDGPSTGSVANRDSVRCRGPTGAGQLAAVHTIRQTFVLAVVRSQIKVFGTQNEAWGKRRRRT